MKKIFLIALLCICQLAFAQDRGTVQGTLTDKEMGGEPLPYANISVKGTTIGTSTDFDGNYTIQVPAGNQTLVFSFVGYQTVEKAVTVVAGQTLTVNQELGASAGQTLDEIEIKATTSREKVSALLTEQKKAEVIKESIGAEELSKKGISNAAAAVTKISGVSKQEGSSNVYVRGLGDRYLNTTMNGLSLPSNNIAKKNIDLALFPSEVIQNVSISKAYASNFYGDFAAGNVDVTSKEYKGSGFLEASVGAGINTNAVGKNFIRNEGPSFFGLYNRYQHNPFAVMLSHGVDPVEASTPVNMSVNISGGKSYAFKDDSKLSLFLTGSFENDYQFLEGVARDYTATLKKEYPNTEKYKYNTTSTLMGTALYRINDNNKVKLTSLFVNNSSDKIEYFGTKGLGFNQASSNDKGSFVANYQFNQDLILVNQLTGEHKFWGQDEENEELKLTWGIGYNNTYAHEPDRKRFIINNYQNLLDNDSNTVASFSQNNSFNNQRYFQDIRDEELNSRINLTYQVAENTKLDFGYNGKIRVRNFDNVRYGYKNISTAGNPLNDINNLDSYFNLQGFYDGVYQTHVFNAIDPSIGITQTNFPGLVENEYEGNLKINAGYVSASINIEDKWFIVPGIRVESLEQEITYNAINLKPSDPGAAKSNETFFLPSINVKYALNEQQNFRLAASKTVSIPEFKEIALFVYEDVTQRIGGNPDLLGGGVSGKSFSNVYNLDLKYENFFSRDELISIAGFAKHIHDPINLVLAADATGTQRYFRTGEKAEVYGVEVEARKNLFQNEDEETIVSAGLNVTYMHTEQDLYATITGQNSQLTTQFNRSSDKLEGASDIILNADISYKPTISENYKPNANLIFSYASDRIFSLGSGSVGNVVEKGVPTLDFILKNKIGENLHLNFSAKNLLNPTYNFFRENTADGDITLSEYKRGINLGLQLKYEF